MADWNRITHRVTKLKIISTWFLEHENEYTVLTWPQQSPHLSVAEHLWDVLEEEIGVIDVQQL